MGVTQYIGARYVPIFADPAEWTNTRTYEPLTIVMHEGNSFTSKQFVPVGIDITNDAFWAETGNYNAQVEAYRQEVLNYNSRFNAVEFDITMLKNYANVKEYGAKGDGITNDTQAFLNAYTSNSNVYFPKGNYIINANISIDKNITVIGDSDSKIIVKDINAFNVICDPSNEFFIAFRNLNFECEGNGSAIKLTGSTNLNWISGQFFIENVHAKCNESFNGTVIDITKCSSAKLFNINIEGKQTGTGIKWHSGINNFLENINIQYMDNGFICDMIMNENINNYEALEGIFIVDSVFLFCDTAVSFNSQNTRTSLYLSIDNCMLDQCGKNAVYIDGVQSPIISNSYLGMRENATGSIIFLDTSKKACGFPTIINNVLAGNSGFEYSAIEINSNNNIDYPSFIGNLLQNVRYGIGGNGNITRGICVNNIAYSGVGRSFISENITHTQLIIAENEVVGFGTNIETGIVSNNSNIVQKIEFGDIGTIEPATPYTAEIFSQNKNVLIILEIENVSSANVSDLTYQIYNNYNVAHAENTIRLQPNEKMNLPLIIPANHYLNLPTGARANTRVNKGYWYTL